MATNLTIEQLSNWSSNPAALARFESLVLLTQRTAFVKTVLNLNESPEFIRGAIQRVLEKHHIACTLPRGRGYVYDQLRLNPEQRYAGSVLLKSLLSSPDFLLEGEEGQLKVTLLDRMIFIYQRHLSITMTTAAEAAVSFEMFYEIYKGYQLAVFELIECTNCSAEFLISYQNTAPRCPLCVAHRHAIPSKRMAPDHVHLRLKVS